MKGLKRGRLVGCKNASNFLLISGFCKTEFFDTSLENDYKNGTIQLGCGSVWSLYGNTLIC